MRQKVSIFFGGIADDQTKIKILNNQKHREVEKDKYNVLNIMPQTELSVYIDNLRNCLNLVKEAFCKITAVQQMSLYLVTNIEIELENLQILHLNQIKAIEEKENKKEVYLYKINWKENMQILYYSNIIFFDNFNKTLPVGMEVSDEVLVNLSDYIFEETGRKTFKMSKLQDEFSYKIIKVNVIEYDVKKKISTNKKEN